jgi:hypothetical protein
MARALPDHVQRLVGPRHQKARNKFGAQPVEHNGERYDSKAELAASRYLDEQRLAGRILSYRRTTPIDRIALLPNPPGRRLTAGEQRYYTADFVLTLPDNTLELLEVKGGMATATPLFRFRLHLLTLYQPETARRLRIVSVRTRKTATGTYASVTPITFGRKATH